MARMVTIYTAENCPYCVSAKRLLKAREVAFEEHKIAWDDDAAWKKIEERSGMKTVPQIFAGDRLVGGYSELAELDRMDGLASLKKAP